MRIGVHEAEDLERLTISPGSNSQEEGVSDSTQVLGTPQSGIQFISTPALDLIIQLISRALHCSAYALP